MAEESWEDIARSQADLLLRQQGTIKRHKDKLEAIKGVWTKYDKRLREYREIDPKGQSDYHGGHAEVISELGKILEGS